jgi:hypothetical protein
LLKYLILTNHNLGAPPLPAESGSKTEIFFFLYLKKLGAGKKIKKCKRKFLFCASVSERGGAKHQAFRS